MMYRKPMTKIMDRHILIELDGDFTDYEIGHLLRHAYLNHKAPHEYDELKKYIRDLVIGKHNSVYVMNNGNPNPLASASVIGAPYLSTIPTGTKLYYDWFGAQDPIKCASSVVGLTNNSTDCSSNTIGFNTWKPELYEYNNGNAVRWSLLYLQMLFNQEYGYEMELKPSLLVGPPGITYVPYVIPKYAYAPYISSNNPLTLSAYYYWSITNIYAPSSISFNYVYFNIYMYGCYTHACACPGAPSIIPLFFSSGSFTFKKDTYYISMWQWAYT